MMMVHPQPPEHGDRGDELETDSFLAAAASSNPNNEPTALRSRSLPSPPRTITNNGILIAAILFVLAGLVLDVFVSRTLSPPEVSSAAVLASAFDERSYRSLRLQNGLEALVISDPSISIGCAALDVAVGSLSDPRSNAGLAHFLEHMLFLSSEKYPLEGEYNQFLGRNGGQANAFTDLAHTAYFFTVGVNSMAGALDRFSRFFIDPVLSPEAAGREMQAVDSEHAKNMRSDPWRGYQLFKSTAREGSALNAFSTGNLATLNTSGVHDALRAFHARHYVAPSMRLVVVSNHSVDELVSLVRGMFAAVRSQPLDLLSPATSSAAVSDASLHAAVEAVDVAASLASPGATSPSLLWSADALPLRVDWRPLENSHVVAFYFPLPPIVSDPGVEAAESGALSGVEEDGGARNSSANTGLTNSGDVRTRAVDFVAHLLGDEGPGSLLAELKLRGLGEELSAGLMIDAPGVAVLEIAVTLSAAPVLQAAQTHAEDADHALLDALHNLTDTVAATLFLYARMLESEVMRSVHTESAPAAALSPAYAEWLQQRAARNLTFLFPERDAEYPSGTALALARRLHRVAPADALAPPSRDIWAPEVILRVLGRITPRNLIVLFRSPVLPSGAALPLREHVYGTEYRSARIDAAHIAGMAALSGSVINANASSSVSSGDAVHLPPRNPFLPSPGSEFNLVLVRQHPSVEELLLSQQQQQGRRAADPVGAGVLQPILLSLPPSETNSTAAAASTNSTATASSATLSRASIWRLWWLPDSLFGLPKSTVYVELAAPCSARSPTLSVLTSLYIESAKDTLTQTMYQAAVAGLEITLERSGVGTGSIVPGLTLRVSGLSEVVPRGVTLALDALLSPDVSRATASWTALASALRNTVQSPPYLQAVGALDSLTGQRSWTDDQLMVAAAGLVGVNASSLALPSPITPHATMLSLFDAASGAVDGAGVQAALQRAISAHGVRVFRDVREVVVGVFGNENAVSAASIMRSVEHAFRAHAIASVNCSSGGSGDSNGSSGGNIRGYAQSQCGTVCSSNDICSDEDTQCDTSSCANATTAAAAAWSEVRSVPINTTLLHRIGGLDEMNVNSVSLVAFQLGVGSSTLTTHPIAVYSNNSSRSSSSRRTVSDDATTRPPALLSALPNRGLAVSDDADRVEAATSARRHRLRMNADVVASSVAASHAHDDSITTPVGRSAHAHDDPITLSVGRNAVDPGTGSLAQSSQTRRNDSNLSSGSCKASSLLLREEALTRRSRLRRLQLDVETSSRRRRLHLDIDAAAAELGSDGTLRSVAIQMLGQLIRDPAFDELRTKQQLGYVVFAQLRSAVTAVHTLRDDGDDVDGGGRLLRNVSALTLDACSRVHGDDDSGADDDALCVSTGARDRSSTVELETRGDVMRSLLLIVQSASLPAATLTSRITAFLSYFARNPPAALQRRGNVSTASYAVGGAAIGGQCNSSSSSSNASHATETAPASGTALGDTLSSASDEWNSAVAGLLAVKRTLPLSLSEEASWAWSHITGRSYRFGLRFAEAVTLRERLTPAHVLALLTREVVGHARALIVEVCGGSDGCPHSAASDDGVGWVSVVVRG